jgi:hypothetical protein
MERIRLKPHHVLDIVAYWKLDDEPGYERKPGENGVRVVRRMMTQDLDIPAEFGPGPDFICVGCSHLQQNGRCEQILTQYGRQVPMDEYNDPLDRRVLDFLGMADGDEMTVRGFLELVNRFTPGVELVSHRPNETDESRCAGYVKGLIALGIRTEE